MKLEKSTIENHNAALLNTHRQRFSFLSPVVPDIEKLLSKLIAFNVAIPSWALGTGGTRFARFSAGGEPRNLEEKIEDIGLLHALNAFKRRHFFAYSMGHSRKSLNHQETCIAARHSI